MTEIMNAIILAAGMGTRLRPLTADRPKCMVEVCGEPMIERQINFLRQIGISQIVLVSGYCAERLDYLRDKYCGLSIIYNDKYDVCNNIYSLYLAQEFFGNTYVLEGDVYLKSNCFVDELSCSTYFAPYRNNYQREWGLKVDENDKLIDIVPGDGSGYIMSGVSYWTREDAQAIKSHLNAVIEGQEYKDLFWDNIVKDIHRTLQISVRRYDDLYEIDTVAELEALELHLKQEL